MPRARALAALALTLLSCDPLWQSHWRRIESPDEAAWFSVDCAGGIGNCHRRAATLCLYGYTVMDRGSGPTVAQAYGSTVVASHRDELVIRCKLEP